MDKHDQPSAAGILKPFTLKFIERGDECLYQASIQVHLRRIGRIAILIGIAVYLTFGVLDQYCVPEEMRTRIWLIRLAALSLPIAIVGLSFTSLFDKANQLLLGLVGLSAALGIIAMMSLMSVASTAYFYPGLVLTTFYTYTFVGTRFVYALAIDLFVLLTYNIVFGAVLQFPPLILTCHDFFIIAANLVAGTAGYLNERQSRLLFLREKELVAQREQNLFKALHDRLTNLPNRELLHERISQEINVTQRVGYFNAGLYLDLDGFKGVNDRFGHKAGDEVLRESARRIASLLRNSDTLSRLGGDEFFILAVDMPSGIAAITLAEQIIDVLERTFLIAGSKMQISCSIGICIFPYDGVTYDDILHRADVAMYEAKAAGKGVAKLYREELETDNAAHEARQAKVGLMRSAG